MGLPSNAGQTSFREVHSHLERHRRDTNGESTRWCFDKIFHIFFLVKCVTYYIIFDNRATILQRCYMFYNWTDALTPQCCAQLLRTLWISIELDKCRKSYNFCFSIALSNCFHWHHQKSEGKIKIAFSDTDLNWKADQPQIGKRAGSDLIKCMYPTRLSEAE